MHDVKVKRVFWC